ncbi:MAG: hypothetical protein HYW98_01350 [Candidatus Wildermuthbacteria bacterium]|nr:hypothetical protein [Candidatus Wildermuthbacteria bacterium]
MESILHSFFYADSLPQVMQAIGSSWGIRMVCMCSVANFFNLLLHLLIGGILLWLIVTRRELRGDSFFFLLLAGIVLSGTSKFLDWTANMYTATGTSVFWSNRLDLTVEGFQLLGMGIILYGILSKLFYVHHVRVHTPSSH